MEMTPQACRKQKLKALVQDMLSEQRWDDFCERIVVPLDVVWSMLWRLSNELNDKDLEDIVQKEL